MTISELNLLDQAGFVRAVGAAFEQSPWIAEDTWPRRPFANVRALHQALCDTVKLSGKDKQLALIRAHPDLAGRVRLTRESHNEQGAAGLLDLAAAELEVFRRKNAAYKEKFGMPFVICARLNNKQSMLAAFEQRLGNEREAETQIALEEIFKIAEFRLRDLVPG